MTGHDQLRDYLEDAHALEQLSLKMTAADALEDSGLRQVFQHHHSETAQHERLVRDGYVQEQTEVASYELLERVAGRLGDTATAEVARQILQDEREMAGKLAGAWDRAAELAVVGQGS